ncbi:MAG TPA: hypothetical protein VIK33_14575 [Anaerolineae bacterium]
MNDKHPISLGRWYGLLCFGAGSILTIIISTIEQGWGPLSGIRPMIGMATLFWVVLGGVTGAWILLGRGWRELDRNIRIRLATAYLILGWAGLFSMTMTMPAANGLIIFLSITAAIVFIAHGLEGRQRKHDEGDIFP